MFFEFFEHIGARIKRERQERGLLRSEVSRATGIAVARLQNIENGYERIRGSELFDLADYFALPYDQILKGATIAAESTETGSERLALRILNDRRVRRLIKRLAAHRQWN